MIREHPEAFAVKYSILFKSYRLSQNSNYPYNWIMGNVKLKFVVKFSEIQVHVDLKDTISSLRLYALNL